MVFQTFHGEPRTDDAEDPHGVRWNVKIPLAVLGVLAATVGFINMVPVQKVTGLPIDFLHQWLEGAEVVEAEFLTSVANYHHLLPFESAYIGGEVTTMLLSAGLSLGLALAGAGLAYRLYNVASPAEHTQRLGGLQTILMHNYYQDEYQVWLAERVTLPISRAADTFDQGIVDGVVDGASSVSLFSGDRVRRLQTGVVSNYAALLTIGLVLLLLGFGFVGGWF
jgi:NADH-quinone oxidoreductase subunit L